jgi:glucokinase
MTRVLAVDVGGTKTVTALFEGASTSDLVLTRSERFESVAFSGILPILGEFLRGERVDAAGFGVAGPVIDGTSRITNLPWVIEIDALRAVCGTEHVALLHDVQIAALGVRAVPEENIVWLQRGKVDPEGVVSLVAVGTGFGRAFLVPPIGGGLARACATEGGHVSFSPRNIIERRLLDYLAARHETVAVEHVLCGPGLQALYDFIVESGLAAATCKFEIDASEDPSAQIGHLGSRDLDDAAAAAVALFIDLLGAELGNIALETLPRGGLYLWGGVARKLRPAIEKGELLDAFTDKYKMGDLLRSIPLALLDEPDLALIGAREAALAVLND